MPRPALVDRILSRVQRVLTSQEPLEALEALEALRGDLDRLEHHLVRRALENGDSLAAVARVLGISRQAAHRRYRHLALGAAARSPSRV